ncbi:virus tail fibre assembly protein, lambda gpK [Kosakonia radicincitans]|uniref:tail fiber assembly protein n=1 Tax=Kosakonia radicincitans TaxID=283686 RepID=UPI0009A86F8F|nr:tail fiber assembly protein [Kosakonia radicincitans]SKB98869.1 virus tail fibre assembly protein, lambda gpK [Kosakonia radicincitans]
MFFNKSNLGFYDPDEKSYYGENWPADSELIEISDAVYAEFTAAPPQGHKISVDADGYPTWVEVSGQIADNNEGIKASLLATAAVYIAPLQDAVDLGIATDAETSALTAWRTYRVLLMRVDTSTAPDIDWPTQPEQAS